MIADYVRTGLVCLCALALSNNSVAQSSGTPIRNIVLVHGAWLVDVNGIIHEMLTLLKCEATRSSIAMRTDLSAELPQIMVDRVQLQQVFMNLMLNAVEAMEDSGGELMVKSQPQHGQFQFSVSDTGAGLPMENTDQIFSAFFTTKPQGSGMGLAISRSMWNRMAAGCGRLPMMDEEQHFISPCRSK